MATENTDSNENKKAGEAAKKPKSKENNKTPVKKKKIIIVTGDNSQGSGQRGGYSSGSYSTGATDAYSTGAPRKPRPAIQSDQSSGQGGNNAAQSEATMGAAARLKAEARPAPHKIIRPSVKPTQMEVEFRKPAAPVRQMKKAKESVASMPAASGRGDVPKCLTAYLPVGPEIGLVGRDQIVDELRAMLDTEKCVALVRGLGGIGKTAVMQKVCDKILTDGNDENHVAWITCGESLEDDLLTLRDAFGVPIEMGREEAFETVFRELQTFPGTLYLFLDDLSRESAPKDLERLNALSPNVHIMITSRREIRGVPCLELNKLDEDSAVEMFYGYYGRDEEREYLSDVKKIIDYVSHNTLLVELLAKAANRFFGTLDVFRRELDEKGLSAVSNVKIEGLNNEIMTIEKIVGELYDISGLSDEQKRIMGLFSIFTPEKEIYGKVIEWAGLDDYEANGLVGLGWLDITEAGYIIHQIVRDSVAKQVGESLRIEEYGDLLGRVVDTENYMPGTLEYTKVRERLALAEDMARYVERRTGRIIKTEEWSEKDISFLKGCSDLFNNMADVYRAQEDYTKTLEYYEKALDIRIRVLGSDHPDTATTYKNIGEIYQEQGEYEIAQKYYDKAQLADQNLINNISIEECLDSFFQKYQDKCPRFTDLQQFVEEKNTDVLNVFQQNQLGYLFRFAESQDGDRRAKEVQELLELSWKLYLIDSDRIKKIKISTTPDVKHSDDDNTKANKKTTPLEGENQKTSEENKEKTQQHEPKSSDLEKATRIVLEDFESWWKEDAKKEGMTFSIEKHAVKQYSGLQFGYDVGMTSKYGELKYRLLFECKNYTSNISDNDQDGIPDLKVRSYAYNLLEYYMECKSEVNNRWVLVCPFGGLQNEFPERLFDHWNEDHTSIKIFAIMENGPSLTCKDFLSVNDEAYRLVYKKDYDGDKTKDDVFNELYKRIVGKDDVREAVLERLSNYTFWEEYRGHRGLLPVPDRKNQIALGQIISFLQRRKENTNDKRKKTLFVIGEYGTGKSWLCYQTIEQIVFHPSIYPFMPFYLRLKDLSQNKNLEDEMEYKSIMDDTLITYYKMYDKWAGECVRKDYLPVFFLDGFDEVFSGLSETDKKIDFLLRIIDELKIWYEKHEIERARQRNTEPLFVVTSRESDFEVGMKSEAFQQQMEQAEIIKLELCTVEEVKEQWNKLEEEDHIDRSWLYQLDQNSAFLNIIRRPVFYRLCSNAIRHGAFKKKVDLASVDEADVLNELFEYDLYNYARGEKAKEDKIRDAIYKCALKCSKEKKSQIVYKGKSINQVIHVGMVKIEKNQEIEGTCWVSFEHNIVREYLTARFLSQCLVNCSPSERKDPMRTTFVKTLQELSLTPEALKLLLLCIEKESPKNNGKQLLKKWLCNESVKKSNSRLSSRLLEILLQPGHTLSGDKKNRLDLSELNASDLCLWNCRIQHVNLRHANLKNWQMINLELDDVDFRNTNMEGLRLAPDKPIRSFCDWKDAKEWHVVALHENGQLMQYSFPDNSWKHYTAKVLLKTEVKDGLCRYGNELLLHSVKELYDEKEKKIYQIQSNNELQRIVTAPGLCGLITKQEDSCQVAVFQENMIPISISLGETEPRNLLLTKNGQIICVKDGALYLVNQNGEMGRICEWERDYECFTASLEPTVEACVYIKRGESLIRVMLDREMHEITSSREVLQIQGELETMRELHALNENALAGIGKNELFILSLENNKGVEEVKSSKMKTAILIRNSLLEDENGENRVRDDKAYELLRTSMC